MSGITQMLMVSGGINDAILVAQVTGATASPTPTSLGAVVGDLAIVITFGSVISAGGAWTVIGTGASRGSIYTRFLTSGDMGSPITTTAGTQDIVLLILRGATSYQTVVTDAAFTSGTHYATAAGFTRNANHAGIIAITNNTSATGGGQASTIAPITAPTGFTTLSINSFAISGEIFFPAIAYRLFPGAPAYVSGTSFTYGDGISGGNARNQYLVVLELLR